MKKERLIQMTMKVSKLIATKKFNYNQYQKNIEHDDEENTSKYNIILLLS